MQLDIHTLVSFEDDRASAASEADQTEQRFKEAALFLQEGTNNHKMHNHPRDPSALRAYRILQSTPMNLAGLLVSGILLSLALIEQPATLDGVPDWVSPMIELFCLAFFAVELALKYQWFKRKAFFQHTRTASKLLIVVVMVADTIAILLVPSPYARFGRSLRPFFLIDNQYSSRVRRVFRQIALSLPPIVDMLVILLVLVLLFGLAGFYLFSSDPGADGFATFGTTLVSLSVLITTSNFPDVMLPSYRKNPWSSVYFIVFLLVCLYILLNLLHAIVYESFAEQEKLKFRKLFLHKRSSLRRAFQEITDGRACMSFAEFKTLLRLFATNRNDQQILVLYKALKRSPNNVEGLSSLEFYGLFDALSLSFTKQTPVLQLYPARLPRQRSAASHEETIHLQPLPPTERRNTIPTGGASIPSESPDVSTHPASAEDAASPIVRATPSALQLDATTGTSRTNSINLAGELSQSQDLTSFGSLDSPAIALKDRFVRFGKASVATATLSRPNPSAGSSSLAAASGTARSNELPGRLAASLREVKSAGLDTDAPAPSQQGRTSGDQLASFATFVPLQRGMGSVADNVEMFSSSSIPSWLATPLYLVKQATLSVWFDRIVAVVVMVNVLLAILEASLFSEQVLHPDQYSPFKWVNLSLALLYVVETSMRLITLGIGGYCVNYFNRIDLLVIMASLLGHMANIDALSIVLLPMRIVRFLTLRKSIRLIISTLISLLPKLFYFFITLMCVFYSFAVIGMELYAGLIVQGCCGPEYDGSAEGLYYVSNFDNLLRAYVLLFELLVANNNNIIMEAVVTVTSYWSRFYFLIFYIVMIVVLLNVVMAFVFDTFLVRIQLLQAAPHELDDDATMTAATVTTRRRSTSDPTRAATATDGLADERSVIHAGGQLLSRVTMGQAAVRVALLPDELRTLVPYEGAQYEEYQSQRQRDTASTSLQSDVPAVDEGLVHFVGRRSLARTDIYLVLCAAELSEWVEEYDQNLQQSGRSRADSSVSHSFEPEPNKPRDLQRMLIVQRNFRQPSSTSLLRRSESDLDDRLVTIA
ncbi:hypothetical protein, variant 1 [Capsaspora owczarzaki ATCC 30864]|uniref:Ion transport domain-containing protein n=1 Tax=Capsaspora owczarzaki (strain ATCC 30864) TaxID=595528 RepID=A0A0D2UE08_CAPO3|nr:hypothetical protein, variant 1 [Capsaspora owczarzaki ATCC 30864]